MGTAFEIERELDVELVMSYDAGTHTVDPVQNPFKLTDVRRKKIFAFIGACKSAKRATVVTSRARPTTPATIQ